MAGFDLQPLGTEMKAKMTPRQKKLLEPFGDVLAEWDQRVIDMTPAERAELKAACEAASTDNCWCGIYDAAQILLPSIRMRDQTLARLAANEQSVNEAKK